MGHLFLWSSLSCLFTWIPLRYVKSDTILSHLLILHLALCGLFLQFFGFCAAMSDAQGAIAFVPIIILLLIGTFTGYREWKPNRASSMRTWAKFFLFVFSMMGPLFLGSYSSKISESIHVKIYGKTPWEFSHPDD